MKNLKEVTDQIVSVVWHYCQRFSLRCWGKVFSLNIRKETCFFLFLYDLIIKIVNFHGRSGKLWREFCQLIMFVCKQKFWFQKRKRSQLSLKCSRVHIEMNYEKFKRSDRPDRFRSKVVKRILSTYNVCGLVSSTVRKFIHSICCKMYMYEFHFTEIGNLFVSILR
jgi:hypothetical protein